MNLLSIFSSVSIGVFFNFTLSPVSSFTTATYVSLYDVNLVQIFSSELNMVCVKPKSPDCFDLIIFLASAMKLQAFFSNARCDIIFLVEFLYVIPTSDLFVDSISLVNLSLVMFILFEYIYVLKRFFVHHFCQEKVGR